MKKKRRKQGRSKFCKTKTADQKRLATEVSFNRVSTNNKTIEKKKKNI